MLTATPIPLPPFTPFVLNASTTGYVINGTYCQNIDGSCVNSTFAVDTPNNRFLIDIGPLGTWISLPNATYVYGQTFTPGCFIMVGRNFTTEYLGYQRAQSRPGSNDPGKASYFGNIDVADACGLIQSLVIDVRNNIAIEAEWSTPTLVPFGPGGSDICFNYIASMENDIDTLDRRSDRTELFVLPPDCYAPTTYCPVAYPPGNPCELCTNC